MEYIKTKLKLFQRGKFQRGKRRQNISQTPTFQRPNALENSVFAKVPREILGEIVEHLPTASAALFSLSCHRIYFSIGSKYLEKLKTSIPERLEFFKVLEDKLPDLIFCDPCGDFHGTKYAKKYLSFWEALSENYRFEPARVFVDKSSGMMGYLPACVMADADSGIENKYFSTTIFKMLMKHYHYFGQDQQCRQLLDLLSGKLFDDPYDFLHYREKAEFRIQDGSLYICNRMNTIGTCVRLERHNISIQICPHNSLVKERKSATLRLQPDHSSSSLDDKWEMFLPCATGSWTKSSNIQKCRWCRTEYMAELEHSQTYGGKLNITIWKDLGNGLDVQPSNGHVSFSNGVRGQYTLELGNLLKSMRDVSWECRSLSRPVKPVETVKGEIASAFAKGWPGEDQK